MRTYDEILASLPSSWDEMKWDTYMRMGHLEDPDEHDPFGAVNKNIEILSILTGLSQKELGDMTPWKIGQLNERLAFMGKLPEVNKDHAIRWKDVDSITYDSFVVYMNFQDRLFEHLPMVIKAFSNTELTAAQIADLSVTEVHSAFFTLNKSVGKFAKATLASLRKQERRNKKTGLTGIVNRGRRLLKSKPRTGGTS